MSLIPIPLFVSTPQPNILDKISVAGSEILACLKSAGGGLGMGVTGQLSREEPLVATNSKRVFVFQD